MEGTGIHDMDRQRIELIVVVDGEQPARSCDAVQFREPPVVLFVLYVIEEAFALCCASWRSASESNSERPLRESASCMGSRPLFIERRSHLGLGRRVRVDEARFPRQSLAHDSRRRLKRSALR